MATVYKSPLTAVASVSSSDFAEYEALASASAEQSDALIAAYANKGTVSGPLTRARRIHADATFMPANPSSLGSDRGGKPVQYIILARSGIKGSRASDANLLTQTRAIQHSTVPTPHFMVGVAGEIVQFADLDIKTNYLAGKTYGPPEAQSRASLMSVIADSVIKMTVAYEAGARGYSAFNPADGDAGISFGFIQFNQRRGALPDLLKDMYAANAEKFKEIFGADSDKMLDVKYLKSSTTDLSRMEDTFIEVAKVPAFQVAQRNLAFKRYWAHANTLVEKLGVTSQRAYALCFDVAVQRGLGQGLEGGIPYASSGTTAAEKLSRFALWADTLEVDGTPSRDKKTGELSKNERRRKLLRDPFLSDAPLFSLSEEELQKQEHGDQVQDETSVVVVLEGRVGDNITLAQRDAVARVMRAITDTYAIKYSTARIFGLDALIPDSKNPGGGLAYADLFAATASVVSPSVVPVWFPVEQPVTGEAIRRAQSALIQKLHSSRNNIQALALLQCYDDVQAEARTAYMATYSRATHTRAAAKEAKVVRTHRAAAVASAPATHSAAKPVPGMTRTSVRGLLFSFETGLWSDNKSGGRIV